MKSRRHSMWCLVSGLCGWLWQWLNPHEAALLQVNCDLAFLGLRDPTAFPLCIGAGCTVGGQHVGQQGLKQTNPRATFLVVLGNAFERLECRSPVFWDVIFFCMFRFLKAPTLGSSWVSLVSSFELNFHAVASLWIGTTVATLAWWTWRSLCALSDWPILCNFLRQRPSRYREPPLNSLGWGRAGSEQSTTPACNGGPHASTIASLTPEANWTLPPDRFNGTSAYSGADLLAWAALETHGNSRALWSSFSFWCDLLFCVSLF